MTDWVQCRARSLDGTYCIEVAGHKGPHCDKWDMKWPQEVEP